MGREKWRLSEQKEATEDTRLRKDEMWTSIQRQDTRASGLSQDVAKAKK